MFKLRVLPLLLCCALVCSSNAEAQTAPLFEDVTEAAGLQKRHRLAEGWARMVIGTGAAWIDFDKDGDLDIFLTHGKGKNDFFRNEGDGTFTEIAEEIGASDRTGQGAAISIADYNNDGWPDVYLANADEDVLLKNNNGESFTDVTADVGLDTLPAARGMSAAWGDYNGDGFLDVYVTNHVNMNTSEEEHLDRLLFNNKGEAFVDVSFLIEEEFLNGYGFIGSWTDFDNDGDLDVFLVNDCGFQRNGVTHTRVFRNDGGDDPLRWQFTEVAAEVGADHCHSGMGLAVGDYNRDGWMDYFYTNIGEKTLLLENTGGQFVDKATEAGVLATNPDTGELWTWGTNFYDLDLDGWLDLYVDAGTLLLATSSEADPQPNLVFMNQGDGTFENISAFSGADNYKRSRTSIFGDYDGDGDPDLFLVNGNEDVYLYRNNFSSENNWLIVSLEGTNGNKDGIGAKIKLTDNAGENQYWEVRSGSSLGGGDDLAAYFGLGTAEVQTVVVTWPSGVVQQLEGLETNQRLKVVEPGQGVSIETPDTATEQLILGAYPNPFSGTVNFSIDGPSATYAASIQLDVFDVLGKRVYTASLPGHSTNAVWHGGDLSDRSLPAGVYFARVQAERQIAFHVVTKQ